MIAYRATASSLTLAKTCALAFILHLRYTANRESYYPAHGEFSG